jgi:hypothetical protein
MALKKRSADKPEPPNPHRGTGVKDDEADARANGRRTNTMTNHAARNRKIVARVAAGATLQQVADAYGLTKQMIGYINKRATGRPLAPHHPEWPDDRVRALRALWRNGVSTAMIALRLDTSKSAVVAKARRLDLPMRMPHNARPGPRAPRDAACPRRLIGARQ